MPTKARNQPYKSLCNTRNQADVGALLVGEGCAGVRVALVVQELKVVLHRLQVDHLRLLVTLHTTGSLNCG